jgi:hypothetical protein
MLYDFGEQNTIVFKVVGVERGQPLLPEVPCLHHMTRALLAEAAVRASGASITFHPAIVMQVMMMQVMMMQVMMMQMS